MAIPLTSILIFSSSARRVSTSLFKFSIWRSLGTEILVKFRRFQTPTRELRCHERPLSTGCFITL